MPYELYAKGLLPGLLGEAHPCQVVDDAFKLNRNDDYLDREIDSKVVALRHKLGPRRVRHGLTNRVEACVQDAAGVRRSYRGRVGGQHLISILPYRHSRSRS